MKEIPVLLITGYLGSGKTTLLNHILTNSEGIRFAVIVNDIGEINVDADLIQKGGIVGSSDNGDLVALQNGCICCSLQSDLIKQIADLISSDKFDYIAIEASGICEPAPIAQAIAQMRIMPGITSNGAIPVLDTIVTVTDALNLKHEFGCGKDLNPEKVGDTDLERLIIEQIEFCNIVLLNKISEVSEEDAKEITAVIRALQPKAKIIPCNYADVDIDELTGTGLFDFEDVATSATWIQEIEKRATPEEEEEAHLHHHDHGHEHHDEHAHGNHDDNHEHHHEHEHHEGTHEHNHEHNHEHGEECQCGHCHHHGHSHTEEFGIETMVYYRRRPFDLNKFDYFVASGWPENIIRTKGLCYFDVNPDMSYLFEQAGVQKNISEAGKWYATAPEEELKILMARDPSLANDWDPEYGDRMIKLVFIGRHIDRQKLISELDNCLAK